MPTVTERPGRADQASGQVSKGVPQRRGSPGHRPAPHDRGRGPRARRRRADARQLGAPRAHRPRRARGTTTEIREENARLRREVKRLTMERDLLKRSVAFWVKELDR